jgi:2-oxoglutarate ferredoxin oxidoreductase subunit alpha
MNKDAKIGIIAMGSSHPAIMESRDQMKVANIQTSYLRMKAIPFTDELKTFIEAHDKLYVVEQNRDSQLRDLIRLEYPQYATKLHSILHYDGLPLDARFVTDAIMEQER